MSARRMENWEIRSDPYIAPELGEYMLVGDVFGDPSRQDGRRICTTRVVKVDGRVITTKSGSVYRLGDPSTGYRQWLRENRPGWNPEQPITLLGGGS